MFEIKRDILITCENFLINLYMQKQPLLGCVFEIFYLFLWTIFGSDIKLTLRWDYLFNTLITICFIIFISLSLLSAIKSVKTNNVLVLIVDKLFFKLKIHLMLIFFYFVIFLRKNNFFVYSVFQFIYHFFLSFNKLSCILELFKKGK